MAVPHKPEGYHTVTPYLIVNDVAGLINFLNEAFGAVESSRHSRPDGRIQHAVVRIGDSAIMMGGATDEFQPMPGMMHLYIEDVDAAHVRALEAGATEVQGPSDQFYGDRTSGVRDRFGNQWWISTHIEDVPPDELEQRARASMQENGQ